MKNLRNILQSKYLYLLIFLLSLCFVFYKVNTKIQSKYKLSDKVFYGVLTSYEVDGNKFKIYLKGKEKLYGIYYIKSEREKEELSGLKLGTKLKVKGTLELPSVNKIFHLFNYREYLLSKKIIYKINIDSFEIVNEKISLMYRFKNMLIGRINKMKSRTYLSMFILGDNSLEEQDIKESYQKLGISHLMAISGMHITLLTTILIFLLNIILGRKRINYFIIFFLLFIYMFITGFSPSVIRATLLFITLSINKIFKLEIKTIYLFLLVLSINLFYNPFIIYSSAFKYSYIISFYLILFNKIINNFNNYFTKIFITSLISFIVSIPITINNSFELNLISPLVNVIFVPFVSIIIFPMSLFSLVFKSLDEIFLSLINILKDLTIFFSKFNIIVIFKYLNIYMFLFYYILITITLMFLLNRKYYGIFIIIGLLIVHYNINYFNLNAYITFIDVGQGDSTLIHFPYNKGNILVDTGGVIQYKKDEWEESDKKFSLTLDSIIPYLKSEGISKIDYLILTHGDFDHMGEAINLVNNFKVENVVFNCGPYNDLERELIKVLENKNIKYYSCIDRLNIDKYKLEFLNTRIYDNENDNSSVIYLNYNNYKSLFMGDAGVGKEKDILEEYNLNDIDFLKVGHHGSNTSSSKEFIDSINPKYSIISVGKNNRYGHPKESVLNVLSKSNIYRTDLDGSIKINNDKYNIRTCPP